MEESAEFLVEEPERARDRIGRGEGWQNVVFTLADPEEEERPDDG